MKHHPQNGLFIAIVIFVSQWSEVYCDGPIGYSSSDDASWAVWNSEISDDILNSHRKELYTDFLAKCRVAAGDEADHVCDRDESFRLQMNNYQPRSCVNFTQMGFKKIRAPESVMELINSFWEKNQGSQRQEWSSITPYHNTWDAQTTVIGIENTELEGGGYYLRAQIADAVRDVMEEWTGMKQAISSVYGIRTYYNQSILTPHIDRFPLVSSAIINVAQDVDEEWPLEVYDHNGFAHNITMKPGDLVLYESHSVIHGRPFPLNGKFYANVFVHFEPLGPLNASENVEIYHDDKKYPPYLIPGSDWEHEWTSKYPSGWNVLTDAQRLVRDGDLKTIRYALQLYPSMLNGTEDWQPIHEAVRHGHYDVVLFLLHELGVNVSSFCTEYGGTPLDVAITYLGHDHEITQIIKGLQGERYNEDETDRGEGDVDTETTGENEEEEDEL